MTNEVESIGKELLLALRPVEDWAFERIRTDGDLMSSGRFAEFTSLLRWYVTGLEVCRFIMEAEGVDIEELMGDTNSAKSSIKLIVENP